MTKPTLTDRDWDVINARPIGTGLYALYQLADDPETYGERAAWWIVTSPDFEEETSGPFPTMELARNDIERLETALAEAHADPYPERVWPECEIN